MKITQKGQSNIQEIDFNNLKFGAAFSDHMLICKHKDGEWGEPEIMPYNSLSIMPGAQVFHYGQSVFEGMKAFKTDQGRLLLFREEDNFNRLNKSAKRLCIPEVPKDIFMEGLHQILKLDSDWVKEGDNFSLYIRPFIFASGQCIKATISNEYTFMIICSPTTTYYDGEMNVKIEQEYTRAVKGGTGAVKAAGNYAASFYPTKLAREKGFSQIIWTDAENHEYLEEAGTMNVWIRIDDTLITPKLSDTILGGITRDSVVQLAKDMGIEVQERAISVQELEEANQNGRLKEAFGTGTAVSVIFIGSITLDSNKMQLPKQEDSYAKKLKKALIDLQHGRLEDKYEWTTEVASSLMPH
jgi:branched-chain amino acid aminotransferase|tara:strand:+ start:662 stop:1726 length:1065 start_codon:yes stop_codon:yes gene_type:complete